MKKLSAAKRRHLDKFIKNLRSQHASLESAIDAFNTALEELNLAETSYNEAAEELCESVDTLLPESDEDGREQWENVKPSRYECEASAADYPELDADGVEELFNTNEDT